MILDFGLPTLSAVHECPATGVLWYFHSYRTRRVSCDLCGWFRWEAS